LGVKKGNPTPLGILLQIDQFASREQRPLVALADQGAQVSVDALLRLVEDGHALVGPPRHRLIAELACQDGVCYLVRQHRLNHGGVVGVNEMRRVTIRPPSARISEWPGDSVGAPVASLYVRA